MRVALLVGLLFVSSQAFAEEWLPFNPPTADTARAIQIDTDSVKYPDNGVATYWLRSKASGADDTPQSFVLSQAVVNCDTRRVYFKTISEYKDGVIEQHLDVNPGIVYGSGLPAGDYFEYCKKFYQFWK